MIELSARDARRLAVRAQLLTSTRPRTIDETAQGLRGIQVDQTAHVAPSPDLVIWSRLGDRTSVADIDQAIEERRLIEIRGFLRPAADVALFLDEMATWPGPDPIPFRSNGVRWVEANLHARDEILEQLRADGPLRAGELEADFARDWQSSGWNARKNVPMMLERLEEQGEVAVSHREGRERVWDLASRIYPHVTPVPVEEALRRREHQFLRAVGIARSSGKACRVEPMDVGDIGERAVVEGVRGEWRVDPELLDSAFTGRTAILSPLDRLVVDRKRMDEIFDFDYTLEMYKPADQRRWGYFALPVLHLDRLVGKVDAESDFRAGTLTVHRLHEDEPWSASARAKVDAELRSLARFLELELR